MSIVYDVGSHAGNDVAYYLRQGHNVVAIEANPLLTHLTRQRFSAQIDSGHLTLLNYAVSDIECNSEFWICDANLEWSSLNQQIASRYETHHHKINIPSVRLDKLFLNYGVPEYLKIDIEGTEDRCLAGITETAMPMYISVECDLISRGCLTDNSLIHRLKRAWV
jgi:FkbM family methyltransferase